MTRRDIIIVAVLANIGVLALLFMLAFRTDEDKVADQSEIAYTLVQEPSTVVAPVENSEVIKPEPADEVDSALDDTAPLAATTDEDVVHFSETEIDPSTPQPKPEIPPVEPPTKPVPTNVKIVEVTVKKGDALEKIARANGTTVDAIMKASQLSTDKLKVGQVLKVPVNPVKAAPKPAAQTAKPAAEKTIAQAEYYTIKAGDNPWKIAKQFNLKVDELLKLNNLDEERARNLKIGDKVRVH